jgi:hypothetical protein
MSSSAYGETPYGGGTGVGIQRSVQIDEMQTQVSQTPPAGNAGGGAGTSGGGAAGGAGMNRQTLDLVVRQVYEILKKRLRAEQARKRLYGDW